MKVTSLLSTESPESPIPAEKVRTVEIPRRDEPVLVAKQVLAPRSTAFAAQGVPEQADKARDTAPPSFRPVSRPDTKPVPLPTDLGTAPDTPVLEPTFQSAVQAPASMDQMGTPFADAPMAMPTPTPTPTAASAPTPESVPTLDTAPVYVDRSGPLAPADVPVGSPLAWRMVDINGSLLLDAGAVVPTVADRDFLFEQFEPQSESVTEHASGATGKAEDASTPMVTSLSDMGLLIGSRLGVRSAGAVQATYASRLIGLTPNDFIFITSPTAAAGRLSLDPRDTVEVVAVSSRAVFLFTCSVESVHTSPSPYAILSKPRAIRRLRERRAERIKTRFPVIFSTTTRPHGPAKGLGMANDISDLGMALATPLDIGSVGEWIKVRFYLDMHSSTVCVEADSQIRNVKTPPADAEGRVTLEYGLEFADLPSESRSILRNFVLSHRSMAGRADS